MRLCTNKIIEIERKTDRGTQVRLKFTGNYRIVDIFGNIEIRVPFGEFLGALKPVLCGVIL